MSTDSRCPLWDSFPGPVQISKRSCLTQARSWFSLLYSMADMSVFDNLRCNICCHTRNVPVIPDDWDGALNTGYSMDPDLDRAQSIRLPVQSIRFKIKLFVYAKFQYNSFTVGNLTHSLILRELNLNFAR